MPIQPRKETDPSQNYLERFPHPLDPIFHPKAIAVIGAKDNQGSVGKTLMQNLHLFQGEVYPVNPKRDQVMGKKSYPSISAISQPIDLAIIATPAITVPSIISECNRANVKCAIVISAGFKELGTKGSELEKELLYEAAKGDIRIIGPNCLGVMNPHIGLNATFARGIAKPGKLAFISQSGAMCTAVLDWSIEQNIGFSAFVSIGSMSDVGWGDLIDYLGSHTETESILLYMETVGDARSFLSAAREIAMEKPIIVIKAGRTKEAAKAAASHTGSLAGSDAVLDAAFKRVGVLRVDTIAELFQMASVLSRQPRPKGPRLAIATNAGGPSVLATDAAIKAGAEIVSLKEETLQKLNQFLPAAWSHGNPVDLLGDADSDRYRRSIDTLLAADEVDGVLAVLSPQDMTDATATAQILINADKKGKPLLASWMGGESVKEAVDLLNCSDIPVFPYPDDAAKIFAKMWHYSMEIVDLYETPAIGAGPDKKSDAADRNEAVRQILCSVQESGRTLLDEYESKKILSLYGIPTVQTEIAKTEEEAVKIAGRIGYPVAVKIHSHTITHKSDVGGVLLNIKDDKSTKKAFALIRQSARDEDFEGVTVQEMVQSKGIELICGSSTDPQFGPVLLFGAGGTLVEIIKDQALAIPPLNVHLARRLTQQTKIYKALCGYRNFKGIDLRALDEMLTRFSRLIVENRMIDECDINPLLAADGALIALDARITVHDAATKIDELPKLAIRPYPLEYVSALTLKNGEELSLRPIRPEDEQKVIAFHHSLSEESVRQRYFAFIDLDQRTSHNRLIRICFNDYDREIALVADTNERIVGICRYVRTSGTRRAHLKMSIVDDYHNLGLGTAMIKELLRIAEKEGIDKISAEILSENEQMIDLCVRVGFKVVKSNYPNITRMVITYGNLD